MNRLISVIIPAYNAERHLAEAVDSVLKQTYSNIEVIIIDDGSTDGTSEIGRACVRRDGRCRYFRSGNVGVSRARNRGIEKSAGSFVAFLDSDDLWEENKLQLQVECLAEKPEAIVLTELKRFVESDGERRYLTTTEPPPFNDRKSYLLILLNFRNSQMTSFATVLMRKQQVQAAGLFDERLRTSEDWDLWVRLASRYEFVNVQVPLVLYRKHEKSLTIRNALKNTLADQLFVMDKVASTGDIPKREIASAKANKYLEFARIYAYRRNRLMAFAFFLCALRTAGPGGIFRLK